MKAPPGRGRPKGSGNESPTHGAQRAREYGDLLAAGVKPAAAARQVAMKWNVAESTVYTDYTRHTISYGQVCDNFGALQALTDDALGRFPDIVLAAIEEQTALPPEQRDVDRIRLLMNIAADQLLNEVGDRAPEVTDPSTIGGRFKRGLKKGKVDKK